jgi:hypothetical protein
VWAVDAKLVPPAPGLCLRVGVTGHRVPPKLPAESEPPLRARVDRILTTIVETAHSPDNRFPWQRSDTRPGKFLLVSSLAEGSDRLVAEAGLAAGYALEAVLPLTRAEYASDFATPESRARSSTYLGTRLRCLNWTAPGTNACAPIRQLASSCCQTSIS